MWEGLYSRMATLESELYPTAESRQLCRERVGWLRERLERSVDILYAAGHVTSVESFLQMLADGWVKPAPGLYRATPAGIEEVDGVFLKVFYERLPENLRDVLPPIWMVSDAEAWAFLKDYGSSVAMWDYMTQNQLPYGHESLSWVGRVSDKWEAISMYRKIKEGRLVVEAPTEEVLSYMRHLMSRCGVAVLWGTGTIERYRSSMVLDTGLKGSVFVVTDVGLSIDEAVSVVPLGKVERKVLEKICGR